MLTVKKGIQSTLFEAPRDSCSVRVRCYFGLDLDWLGKINFCLKSQLTSIGVRENSLKNC